MKDDTMTVLQRLLRGHQATLQSALTHARDAVPHPTLKGDASEQRWREMLTTHLPRRYRVCNGMVVDSSGNCSEQIDVIVHDANFCPVFMQATDGCCFVPAESVYGVFEVKQELDSDYVTAAGAKVASVRRLHRTSAPIVDRGERHPPRALPEILGGVLSLTTVWADGLGEGFRAALSKLQPSERLDLGCSLEACAFEVLAGGEVANPRVYAGDEALVTFFIRLVHRLQAVGTVPAIDWDAYLRAALPSMATAARA